MSGSGNGSGVGREHYGRVYDDNNVMRKKSVFVHFQQNQPDVAGM